MADPSHIRKRSREVARLAENLVATHREPQHKLHRRLDEFEGSSSPQPPSSGGHGNDSNGDAVNGQASGSGTGTGSAGGGGSGSGSGSGSGNGNGNGGNTSRNGRMSQRSRHARGSNRSNGTSNIGEESGYWDSSRGGLERVVAGINEENDNLTEILKMDKAMGAMESDKVSNEDMKQLEELCRAGVKLSENNLSNLKEVIEQLKVVRAVVSAKEQAEAPATGLTKRSSTRDSTAASSLYDFDAAGDSPVPSPIGGPTRKYGERSSNRDRDSVPPKAESVEPQGPSGSGGGSVSTPGGTSGAMSSAAAAAAAASAGSGFINKSKVVFQKGDEVAFKPKTVNGDQVSDWILGEVAQVLGEGKSRRYKVLDVEPDDQSKQKEYRSSASSMIPIPPESSVPTLPDWEAGKVVLALYPNTTTFYKAEVDSATDDGKGVNLKFEGENDSSTLQQVERRFVIEYRA